MNIVKVTLFQKNITTDITRDQKQKLIAQKSDFLLFPRFFPHIGKVTERNILSNHKFYIDKLLEISEYYKGVVIGGSIIREVDGKIYESTPIIKDINIIDWYDRRLPEKVGDLKISDGQSEHIFILAGLRFALLIGEEIRNDEYLSNIQSEGVEIVFNPCSVLVSELEASLYNRDLDYYNEMSRKYSLNLLRASGLGKFFDREMSGRSFYSTSSGVKWKVAAFENQLEIIKTVNINIMSPIGVK